MRRLYRYWLAHLPVHELVAAFMGVKQQAQLPPPAATAAVDDPSGIGAMILQFPDGQVKAQ